MKKVPDHLYEEKHEFGVKSSWGYDWIYCREELGWDFPRLRSFFYTCASEKEKKTIIAFIKRIEQRLRLPKDKRARFESTNKPHIFFVRLGWWATKTRRACFTLLIRIGSRYNSSKRDWRKTIHRDRRYRRGHKALFRFTDGHTKIKYRSSGDPYYPPDKFQWCDYFGKMDSKKLKEVML